jgi:hypothetical protein
MGELKVNAQKITKIFLRVFIASIVVTAIMGIAAISIPTRNWDFEIKIFLTTLIVAGASICGLACGGCLSRGQRALPIVGLALTAIAAVLLMVGMWAEVNSEWYWKATIVASIYAVGCSHLSMLFLADLAPRYRWSYIVAYQLILGLATLLAAITVFELMDRYENLWRLTGALSILVAAITLLVPVFHYMSREELAAAKEAADPVFAVDEEIARLKKRLIELENKRRNLLGRPTIVGVGKLSVPNDLDAS